VKAPRPTRPTLRILAKGKCTTGRIWSYVRDDRPFAGPAPPAAVYYASGDRRGEHPQKHLAGFSGILQADCYNGFEPLFDPRMRASPITPAFCFAHARRGFFELADIEKKAREGEKGKPISPIALEAVLRLDALFEIERAINGRNPEERRTVRQEKSKPLFDDMHAWLLRERETLSRSAEVLKPINYMLKRWADFARFLDDGRICLSTDGAEKREFSGRRGGLGRSLGRLFLPRRHHVLVGLLGTLNVIGFSLSDLLDPIVATWSRLAIFAWSAGLERRFA